MLKDNPIFSKFEKKNFEKKFFSARKCCPKSGSDQKMQFGALGVK